MAKKSNPSEKNTGFSELYSNTEKFVDKYRNALTIGLGAIVVVVLGFLAYQRFMVEPRIKKSHNEKTMTDDQSLRIEAGQSSDSVIVSGLTDYLAANSDNPAAPRAAFQLGIAQRNLGKYQEALSTLESLQMENDVLTPLLEANIGDCYVELGNLESAIEHFAKGADRASQGKAEGALAPYCLYKQATATLEQGNTESARDLLLRIINEYPTATYYAKRAEALELTLPR